MKTLRFLITVCMGIFCLALPLKAAGSLSDENQIKRMLSDRNHQAWDRIWEKVTVHGERILSPRIDGTGTANALREQGWRDGMSSGTNGGALNVAQEAEKEKGKDCHKYKRAIDHIMAANNTLVVGTLMWGILYTHPVSAGTLLLFELGGAFAVNIVTYEAMDNVWDSICP